MQGSATYYSLDLHGLMDYLYKLCTHPIFFWPFSLVPMKFIPPRPRKELEFASTYKKQSVKKPRQ
jgi:hypothetical protein